MSYRMLIFDNDLIRSPCVYKHNKVGEYFYKSDEEQIVFPVLKTHMDSYITYFKDICINVELINY